jgi:peptidoglycan/LPS O-acetylase OafA/YrhL
LSDTNYENAAAFDGIRGIAFLLVLFIHSIALNIDSSGAYLQGTGKYGVWLFFVLSAFLLTKNYIIPNRSKSAYIISRFTRIIPLYLIACFAYHVVGVFIIPSGELEKVAFILYGPAHLWTIPVEFYFYFFLLALWIIIKKPSNRDYAFIALSVLSLAALTFISKTDNSVNFLWFLPSFLVGYLLARVWPSLSRLLKYSPPSFPG